MEAQYYTGVINTLNTAFRDMHELKTLDVDHLRNVVNARNAVITDAERHGYKVMYLDRIHKYLVR